MGKCIILALLIFCAALFTTGIIFAEEGEGEKLKLKSFELRDGLGLLSPMKEGLSASAELIADGLIPFQESPPRASSAQGGIAGAVPYRSPAPAFSRNILVSRDLGLPIHTEPHLAVNPNDPKHLVIAEIDYGLRYNPIYVSFDGGENWRGPNRVPLVTETFFAADPVVAFDRQNNAYEVFMSVGEESYDLGLFLIDIPKSYIAISKSSDGGLTWLSPVAAARNEFLAELKPDKFGAPRGLLVFTFLDKPWFDIGPDSNNPKNDIMVVSYTAFKEYFALSYSGELAFLMPVRIESYIETVVSKDGGATWSKPQVVSLVRKIFELGEQSGQSIRVKVVQGSQPKVAKDGTAYIVWYDSTDDGTSEGRGQIYLIKSTDGGKTWDKPSMAVDFLEVARSPHSVPFRNSSSFPQIALGQSGEVYIVYGAIPADKATDEGDIYFVKSINGKDFSEPIRLNQDKTEKIQFFPAAATDQAGNIHVMWGDTRDDLAGLTYHIYYTRSLDRGGAWGFESKERGIQEPDMRVTDFASNPNNGFPGGRFIGDYFAITATSEEDVYIVWADTRLGEYGPMSQKIGFARRKAIASPQLVLNPSRGNAGEIIDIQAHNFQADLNMYIEVGGVIVGTRRTDDNGQLSYRVLTPMSAKGSLDIVIYDESGNVASSAFYSNGYIREDEDGMVKNPVQQNAEQKASSDALPSPQDLQDKKSYSKEELFFLLFPGITILLIAGIFMYFYKRHAKR